MIEIEKSSKSHIDSHNWIYCGHHQFKVFSLDDNETIYFEKEPFGKKYNQISKIEFSEQNNRLVLITFKGDFCIYKIDHKSKSVIKEYTYIQKGNFYCSDAFMTLSESDYIKIVLEHKGKYVIRSIYFDGKIIDKTCETFVLGNFLHDPELRSFVSNDSNEKPKFDFFKEDCNGLEYLSSFNSSYVAICNVRRKSILIFPIKE